MFTEFTIISVVITAFAIELDKITQFTHPILHLIAAAGVLVVVYSMAFAT